MNRGRRRHPYDIEPRTERRIITERDLTKDAVKTSWHTREKPPPCLTLCGKDRSRRAIYSVFCDIHHKEWMLAREDPMTASLLGWALDMRVLHFNNQAVCLWPHMDDSPQIDPARGSHSVGF